MENFSKIVGINLLILMACSLGITLGNQGEDLAIAIFIMFLIIAQVIANLILGIFHYIKGRKSLGHTFMTSIAIVGILGASTCYGALNFF